MPDDMTGLTHRFPQSVRDSLAELRQLAKTVKSQEEWKALGRWATPDEIALSESLRKPHHCTGHSVRTGLACTMSRVNGLTVCRRHGGAITRVKEKAAQRLAKAVPTVLESMVNAATQTENLNAAVKAGTDLLDRAGVGELVQAKVRSSEHRDGQSRIEVKIGFLSVPGQEPTTILIPNPDSQIFDGEKA